MSVIKNNISKKIFLIAVILLPGVYCMGQQYARIVSLAQSLTKNIYYLEAQDKIVGCTSYCEEAVKDNKEIVATAVQVNIEKTISLAPDLILATSLTNPETIETLRQFGIHVEIFESAKSFDGICQQFERLGNLVNKKDKATEIINNSKRKIDSLEKLINFKTTPKVFFQIGANPLFTVIPNTFMDDYIQYIKATNIASDMKQGTITRETVIARNPDIIFIVTMGVTGAEEKSTWENFKDLSATKNKRIYIIDSENACTPTPVTFVKTLETIINLVNG